VNILFMCVANSARSQLAEGLARQMFPNAEIKSAGSHPGKLNPYAVTAMKEIGVDISQQYSKSFDNLAPTFIAEIDYIITLCAEEVCPVIIVPSARKLHWPFPDPATNDALFDDEVLRRFRETRDSILARMKEFKLEIEK
jgi:arsenate reductase (thioredoxin)